MVMSHSARVAVVCFLTVLSLAGTASANSPPVFLQNIANDFVMSEIAPQVHLIPVAKNTGFAREWFFEDTVGGLVYIVSRNNPKLVLGRKTQTPLDQIDDLALSARFGG